MLEKRVSVLSTTGGSYFKTRPNSFSRAPLFCSALPAKGRNRIPKIGIPLCTFSSLSNSPTHFLPRKISHFSAFWVFFGIPGKRSDIFFLWDFLGRNLAARECATRKMHFCCPPRIFLSSSGRSQTWAILGCRCLLLLAVLFSHTVHASLF